MLRVLTPRLGKSWLLRKSVDSQLNRNCKLSLAVISYLANIGLSAVITLFVFVNLCLLGMLRRDYTAHYV